VVEVKRLSIKDKHSDVTLSLLIKERTLDLKFAGSIYGATLDAMVTDPVKHVGHAAGNLRVRVDRDHPELTTGDGRLTGENMNLAVLIGEPLTIGRLDIQATPATLQINEVQLNWAGQPA